MKLKLLSDLHIEGFANKEIYKNKDDVDILVLAGDINVRADNVYKDLVRFAENYENVVYVPGNHEWYHNSYETFDTRLRALVQGKYNIHYLCNDVANIEGISFIGTPLWSNFRGNDRYAEEVKGLISDFRWYTPQECKKRGEFAQMWLKDTYENTPGTKVIVTHWLPAVECISPKFAMEVTLNRYFANDMGEWIKELSDVPYWFFGHTHDSVDVTLGETRLIANPAGYRHRSGYYENPKFSESAIYEI